MALFLTFLCAGEKKAAGGGEGHKRGRGLTSSMFIFN